MFHSRRRLAPRAFVGLMLLSLSLAGTAAASHAGDGRLEGPYAIEGKVKEASGVFRDQEGDRVRRTYFVSPRCEGGACDTTLYREASGGSYVRSVLEHRDVGRYRAREEGSGRCESGGQFEVKTTIRVHVEHTRGGLARKISGSTETRAEGCAGGRQQARFEGKLDVVN